MSRFSAEKRSNGGDLPTPAKIFDEWVIMDNGYIYGPLNHISWPDTPEGQYQAVNIAKALNEVREQGYLRAQSDIRRALGVTRP